MKIVQRIAICVVMLLGWAAAAQAAEPDSVRVGDRWSYDIKDDLTGDLRHSVTVVVVEVTDKEITTRAPMRGKDRPQTMIFDLDWGRIDDGAWKLSPAASASRCRCRLASSGDRMQTPSIGNQASHTARPELRKSSSKSRSQRLPARSIPIRSKRPRDW